MILKSKIKMLLFSSLIIVSINSRLLIFLRQKLFYSIPNQEGDKKNPPGATDPCEY